MSDEQTTAPVRKRRPVWGALKLVVGLFFSLPVTALIGLYLGLWLGGQALLLPEGATAEVERRLNAEMRKGALEIGDIAVAVGDDQRPKLVFLNVGVRDASGGAAVAVQRVTAELAVSALLRGRPGLANLELEGAQMTVRRDARGAFSVDFGAGAGDQARSLAEMLETLDASLGRPELAEIRTLNVNGLTLVLEDARSGRIWQAANARLLVRKSDEDLSMTLASDVFNGTDILGEVQLSATFDRGTRNTALQARIRDVAAADLALQSPALSWLSVIDAPLSGAVRTTFDGEGALTALAGTLDLSNGALQPTPASTPVPFQSAEVYFDVDPDAQRIRFSNLSVISETLTLRATGSTDLTEFNGPWPGAFVSQLQITEATYAADGMFENPVSLVRGQADFRLRLDPFEVDVGQVWVETETAEAVANAKVTANDAGWQVSLDAKSDAVTAKEVVASWPVFIAPRTRAWLSENVLDGTLRNVSTALRFTAGTRPDLGLSFDYDDVDLRFLRQIPPVTHAKGTANLIDNRFTIRVAEGAIEGLDGNGTMRADGTVFSILDTKQKPAVGELLLETSGPLQTALELLDLPPFRVFERVGRSPSLGTGTARARADVRVPLRRGNQREDIDYTVTARAFDVVSDVLVPGRRLTSSALDIAVTPDLVEISGPAALDGVPVTAKWSQPIGPGAPRGEVTGQASVSPDVLRRLGIELPDALFSGTTTADWTLRFPEGEVPELTVTSDLRGVSLSIDAVGWRKAANAPGGLDLIVGLGERPDVRTLAVSAQGLAAEGRLEFDDNGAFAAADFERVRLEDYLDARVRITPGRSAGNPNVEVTGGSFDLRRADFGGGSDGNGGSGITFDLNEVAISDGIVLRPLRGRLTTGGGLSGSFEGSLNGASPVRGDLVPFRGRTAIRLRSDNAGQTVRASGLMDNTYGGQLTMTLTPRADVGYDGAFRIDDITLRQAPVMAELLNAISVVGLFDQLDGPGINFDVVDGRFVLTPDRLTLSQAAATGPSMGVSLDGVYDLGSRQLDMQGVISPVYFLNAIGQIFTRRGEGLFGFSFRVTGAAAQPQVSVNPLSILTPGMFREIFRRPPPTE